MTFHIYVKNEIFRSVLSIRIVLEHGVQSCCEAHILYMKTAASWNSTNDIEQINASPKTFRHNIN